MQNIQSNPKIILLLILLITPITGVSIDIYMPSLPYIVKFFDSNSTLAGLTVVSYLLGYGLLVTTIGSVSDSKGRRKILLLCLAAFTLISTLIPFSPNMTSLLFLRFLQGMAVAGPSIISKTLLSDCFSGKKLQHYAIYNNIAWACSPIIAPAIGGYLQYYFNWQAPFYFLSIYGLVALLSIYFFLPETLHTKQPLSFSSALKNYRSVLTHPVFVCLALLLTLTYSLISVFNVLGPFLIQDLLFATPIEYGHYALLLGLAWLLGNIINRFLIERLTKQTLLVGSLVACAIVALLFLAWSYFVPISLIAILTSTFLLFTFAGIAFPVGYSTCLGLFPHIGGAASAVMTSMYIIGSALITAFASLLTLHNQRPIAILYLALMSLCLLILGFLLKKEKQ